MSPQEKQHRFRIALAFALVYVVWGSTYLAIGIVVEHIPPTMMGAVRFLVAGPLMLAWCALSGRSIRISRHTAVRLFAIGVLLLTGGNVMVGWAEKYVPTGLAALLVAVVPIWVAIIEAWVLRSDRLAVRGIVGLGLGIVGLVVLLWPKIQQGNGTHANQMFLLGAGALMIASLSWALGSVLSRRWQLSVGPMAATAWEMTFAGIVNTALAFGVGAHRDVIWTGKGVAAMIYLIVAGSWIGFTAYIWLLDHVPTPKVATYAYVNPVVAVFLGWLILNERVDGWMFAGTLVIVAAVALVTTSRLKKASTPAAAPARLPACETGAD